MEMIHLPGGTITLGTPTTAIDELMQCYAINFRGLFAPETPQHTVTLAPFAIDPYPVTNRLFKRFVDDQPQWRRDRIPAHLHNGSYLQHWQENQYPAGQAEHPVVHICWYAAIAYAQWANQRLPTEAEWEYAVRGGLPDTEFPWGNAAVDPSRANYGDSGVGMTTPVGSYPPNSYGLYDLAGNVWEYCLDAWQEDFYTGSPVENPVAGDHWFTGDDYLQVTTRRVIRGGSWGRRAG